MAEAFLNSTTFNVQAIGTTLGTGATTVLQTVTVSNVELLNKLQNTRGGRRLLCTDCLSF